MRNPQFSLCVGCGGAIHDQFILRVAPNLEWHAACLKCNECQMFLDETCTCFVRDGKTYCKKDYVRYKKSLTWITMVHLVQKPLSCNCAALVFLPMHFYLKQCRRNERPSTLSTHVQIQ